MVRTRSSGVLEDNKLLSKKPEPNKEKKFVSSGLRSGLKRTEPQPKKITQKIAKPKLARTGLRSRNSNSKKIETTKPVIKRPVVSLRKLGRETKKEVPELNEANKKGLKLKKAEGFSDFSSDDNEPLLAVKKPKVLPTKKSEKMVSNIVKGGKKIFGKTRSKTCESEVIKTIARPTRKTKEAAVLYVEMITKKLVSPDKSGDDDVSSVDSFPELPNAKRSGEYFIGCLFFSVCNWRKCVIYFVFFRATRN